MHYLQRACLYLVWGLLSGLYEPVLAQEAVGERVETTIEEHLRQRLEKLERWGIKQLLYTERQVDQAQKKRAKISTNPEELALLAGDEDSGVRFYVASNRHAALPVLEGLARDPVDFVRSGVALGLWYDRGAADSVRAQVEQLGTALAGDKQVLVRLVLAANPAAPPAVFVQLSRDPDYLVREKLSKNPYIGQEALEYLVQDSVLTIQLNALIHKNTPPQILAAHSTNEAWQVRQAVCQNPNVSADVLAQLSRDPQADVRRQVARHPRTLPITLKALLKDSDIQVLQAIAAHPEADRGILETLAMHQDKTVRSKAEQRLEPILRKEIREDVLERWNLN